MDNNKPLTNEKQTLTEVVPAAPKMPDELSGIHIEARFKISDPESGNVIVEGRA